MTLAARIKPLKDGLALDVGAARVELRAAELPASQGAENRTQYQQQFKTLDRDGNGYLDMNEVGQIPFFKSAFKVMDADGDGQLFEKEVLAYLDQYLEAYPELGGVHGLSPKLIYEEYRVRQLYGDKPTIDRTGSIRSPPLSMWTMS